MIKIENNTISKLEDSTVRTVTNYNPIPSSAISTDHHISIGGGLLSLRLYGTWSFYVDNVEVVFNLDELQPFTKIRQTKTLYDTKNNYVMSLTLKNPFLNLNVTAVKFDISLGIGASSKDIPKTSLTYPSYTVEHYINLTHPHEIIGDMKITGSLEATEDLNTSGVIKASNFTSGAPLVFKKNIVKLKVELASSTPIGGITPLLFKYIDNKPILSNENDNIYILCIINSSGSVKLKTDELLSIQHAWTFLDQDLHIWSNKVTLHATDNSEFNVVFTEDYGKISSGRDGNGWDEVNWNKDYIENNDLTLIQYVLYAQTTN